MNISAREKRFIAVGAGAFVLVFLLFFSDRILPSRGDLSRKVEFKKQVLLKYRETLREEENYKSRLEQYRQRLQQDESRLLPGDNPSIAQAELQKVLKDLADQNGVEIIRKDNQREQKMQDNLVKISVRIETNCQPEQLVSFLAAVENYEKFLTLDELVINSIRMPKKYEIRPGITVSGYLRGSEAKPLEKAASGLSQVG